MIKTKRKYLCRVRKQASYDPGRMLHSPNMELDKNGKAAKRERKQEDMRKVGKKTGKQANDHLSASSDKLESSSVFSV